MSRQLVNGAIAPLIEVPASAFTGEKAVAIVSRVRKSTFVEDQDHKHVRVDPTAVLGYNPMRKDSRPPWWASGLTDQQLLELSPEDVVLLKKDARNTKRRELAILTAVRRTLDDRLRLERREIEKRRKAENAERRVREAALGASMGASSLQSGYA